MPPRRLRCASFRTTRWFAVLALLLGPPAAGALGRDGREAPTFGVDTPTAGFDTPTQEPTPGTPTQTATATPTTDLLESTATSLALTLTPALPSETPTSGPTGSPSVPPTQPSATPTPPPATPTATLAVACAIVEGPFVSRDSTTAIISWRTNEDSDGSASSVGAESFPTVSDPAIGREHEITVNGLSALTVYDYQVDSDCDAGVARGAGGTAARRGSFTTRPLGAPDIVEGPDVPGFGIGTGSAVVVWRTDIPADARVEFGPDTNYGTVVQSGNLREEHLLLLEGLTPGETYHYRVESCDAFGSCTQGEDQVFEATPAPGDGLPVIVQKDAVEELDVTDRSAFIRWLTDEPASSAVEFGAGPGLEFVATSDGLALDHRFLLTGLLAGTSYCHRAVSADAEGNLVASGVSCFTTDTLPDAAPPVLVDLGGRRTTRAIPEVTYITDDRFVLEWQTDEPASAELFVDPALRGVGGESWLSSGVRKRFSASVRVRARRRGSDTYTYVLRLTDVGGNTSVFESPVGSLITLQEDTTAPVLNGEVRLSAARSNRVVLEWTTDEASDSRARVLVNGIPTGRRWLDPEPSRRHRLELTRIGGVARPFDVAVQSCNLEGLCMQEEILAIDAGLFVGALDARGLGAVLLGLGLAGACLLLAPRRRA